MAFRLGRIPTAVQSVALPYGITVEVRPLTTPLWHAAHASALRAVMALVEGEEVRDDLGIDRASIPDLTDQDAKEGFRQLLFAQALARAAIISWQGVLNADDGRPAPVTPAAINELMLVHSIAEAFVHGYTARIIKALEEGNASRPSPNGTSATGPHIAGPAGRKTRHAVEDAVPQTASAAPMSRKRHAPRKATRSGH